MPARAPADPPDGGSGCAAVRRELRECCVADKHRRQAKGALGGAGQRGTADTCSTRSPLSLTLVLSPLRPPARSSACQSQRGGGWVRLSRENSD